MNRYLIHSLALSFAAAMTLSLSAQTTEARGQASQTDSMSKSSAAGMPVADAKFMKKAASGGMAEVELGKLAVQKASSDQVKQFGQRMIDDHSKANEQLNQLASQEHIDLPKQPYAKERETKARLEKLSGVEFDQAYMTDMVNDHKQDVAEFQQESTSAKDPALKSFVEQTLPVLREHLNQAQQILPAQKAEADHAGNTAR
jgi:putative membrane protein